MLPAAAVLVLLLVVGVFVLRVPASSTGSPAVPRLLVAGRLLIAAGCTALALIVSLLLTTGMFGLFFFFVIYSPVSGPALLAGYGVLLAGRRLSRGEWGWRLPAVLGALVLAAAAAFWAVFFWSIGPVDDFALLATTPRMQTIAALSGTSGALALGGILTLVGLRRPQVETAAPGGVAPAAVGPGAAPSTHDLGGTPPATARVDGAAAVLRVVAGVTLVAAVLAALWMNQPQLTLSDSRTQQSCDELARGVTGYLTTAGADSPQPLVLPAAQVVGTGLVADPPPLTPIYPDAPPRPNTWNGHPSAVAVQRYDDQDARATEGEIRELLRQAGMTSGKATVSEVNGDITYLQVPYQGKGGSGSAEWQRCKGGAVTVLAQEVRPERSGLCAEQRRQPRCVRLSAAAEPLLTLAHQSRSPRAKNSDPAFALRGRKLTVSTVVGTDTPRFALGSSIDSALRGWEPVRPRPTCRADQICPLEAPRLQTFDWYDDGPVVGVFRRGRMTARVELVPGPGELTTLRAIVTEG